MVKGQEVLTTIGKRLFGEKFSLEDESMRKLYKEVFESCIRGLDNWQEKGTMIVGNVGVGKTWLFKVMQKAFIDSRSGFVWFNCKNTKDYLETFSLTELKERYGAGLKQDILFEDLGIGNPVEKEYGNSINLMAELLMDRYELFINEGYKTHITTNKYTSLPQDPKYHNVVTLTHQFGDRVVDRMFEMCYIKQWKGKSLRRNEQ
jgi:energy-coupling factor transporter ATP-binding protein EcfA2